MKTNFMAIDLFSGAGGLHLGFEKAGFNISLCIDNDELVEKTHLYNFSHIPFLKEDVSNLNLDVIRKAVGNEIDIIMGGPPCQGFSTIGKRVSSDEKKRIAFDNRNELVFSYANIIASLKPKFIVMENVKGILTMDGGRYMQNLLGKIKKSGYSVDYKLINMADYGIPQIRERVIIIGNRLGLPVTFPEPTHSELGGNGKKKWVNCWTVIKDLATVDDDKAFNHVALKHTSLNIERYKMIPEGGRLPEKELQDRLYRKNFGNTFKRLHRERPALTMVPGNDAFPIHPTLNRSLTVREAARIQTFPDNMIFQGNRRQQGHQVGNAVPPLFSEILAKHMLKVMKGVLC